MTRRSILHVAPWNSGIEGGVLNVASGLLGLSQELAPELRVRQLDCGTSYGHGDRRLVSRLLRNLRAAAAVAWGARGARVVHLHVSETAMSRDLFLGCLSAVMGAKTLLHMHVHRGPEAPRGLAKRLLLRTSAPLVSRALFLTRTTARFFERIYGGKSSWFHNFSRVPRHVETAAKEDIVLYLGRMDERKGISTLLAGVDVVERHGWQTVFCGSFDPSDRDFERATLDAISRVPGARWLGRVEGEEKEDILRRASILVLPSRSEVFPVVLVEAAASGCAIVSTPVGEVEEIIENERSGLLVPVDDVARLRSALERLMTDETARSHMVQRSHAVALEEFSREAMLRRLEMIYREIGILTPRDPSPATAASDGSPS